MRQQRDELAVSVATDNVVSSEHRVFGAPLPGSMMEFADARVAPPDASLLDVPHLDRVNDLVAGGDGANHDHGIALLHELLL